jgi:hypothetical protein
MRVAVMALALGMALASPVQAAEIFDSRQFEAFLEEREKRFISVWENEVRAGIDAVPDYAGSADNLPLRWVECRTTPSLTQAGPAAIEMDRRLLALQFYLQQVVLYYVLGSDAVPSPEAVDRYAASLSAVVKKRADDCVVKGPVPWPLEEIVRAAYFREAGDRYPQIAADAESRIGAVEIADQIAVMPAYFVVIHEAGHHFADVRKAGNPFNREADADRFAARVLEANGMPPVLGLPFLRLYSDQDNESAIACRLSLVARNWVDPGFLSAHPLAYRRRLEALRAYYAGMAPEGCEDGF